MLHFLLKSGSSQLRRYHNLSFDKVEIVFVHKKNGIKITSWNKIHMFEQRISSGVRECHENEIGLNVQNLRIYKHFNTYFCIHV